MGEAKKKLWLVRLEVNMDASHEVKVLVKATKEHLARQKAIKECYAQGYFYASPISCEVCK